MTAFALEVRELTVEERDWVGGGREMGFWESVGFVVDNPFTSLGAAFDRFQQSPLTGFSLDLHRTYGSTGLMRG
jgi:hypothetical protein